MSEVVDGKTARSCNVHANGSSQAVPEAQATLVAPPGTYTLNTRAVVNGSTVTFSPKSVIVIEGVHTVIEINGPTLNLESPIAELYTYDQQVTVKGTATDDAGVKSVTVNGQSVTIESTGNINDPHEVKFETTLPLANGPNKIEVVATDTSNKIARDTRYVYRDSGKPTLVVTPANGTVTEDTVITLTGTATDDNEITKITVNGLSVDFHSTNNPNDPHEVTFSKSYNLAEGPNRFTVTATDNCKRSTTVVNIITNADKDIIPPVFGAIQDITLELTAPEGTAYTLTKPMVTDNIDPAPKVTSDAPAVFPMGKTKVTWTATDNMGNSATAIQYVTVVDTTKPVLTVPASLTVEATATKTPVNIGQATASDIAAVTVTSNAPVDGLYALGTTTITWTATDANGNVTTGTQTITVVDTTKPTLNIPDNITIEATGIKTPVEIDQATADDIFDVKVTNNAPTDGLYALGTTTITWTATDANGNVTTGTQTITVVDTTKPTLNIPDNITIEATGIKAPVEIGQATADDIFDVTITNNAPTDGQYTLGTTTITWTATDANGNVTTGTQTITVVDTTKPTLNIPDNITIEATGIKTPVEIGQATADDIFDVTITNNAPTDGLYALGTTTVTWTATDANGNVTTGTQTITVVDTTKPTLNVPADIIVKSTGVKTYVAIGQATASDIFNVTIANNAPADSMYEPGTTIVTWTATDANGNQTTGTQRITVIGPLSCNGAIIHGPLTAGQIYSNGSVQIYGNCRANLISSTGFITITGQNQVGTILRNQPTMPLPKPDWQRLSAMTNRRTETMLNQPNIRNCRFDTSVMFNASATLSGIIVVKGDLTINGDTRLNNAAIFCTGKITFNGSLNGTGLLYAGSGIVNNANTQLSGALFTGGLWEVSGVTEIRDYNIQDYLRYFVY